ncbi:MAG: hypothetical protein FJY97_15305 [candidate division Zixibacteria bacterium]|nr:hypothetical protein [candidate division Zixibacteria bacterium]
MISFYCWRPVFSAAVLLAALYLTPGTSAQTEESVVTATAVLSVDKAVQGKTFQAAVMATLADGFHVNAHKPTEKWLIPIELTIAPLKGVTVEPVLYPRPIEKALAFSDGQKLALYEETFTVGVSIKVDKTLAPGKYTLKGTLGYQACNDQMCMAPDEIPVEIAFQVVKTGQAAKSVNRDVFTKDPFLPKTVGGK